MSASLPLWVHGLEVRLGPAAVLEGLELELAAGDLVWLSGRNGAGKSTLLRAVAGLLPFRGEVAVCGHPPRSLPARGSFVYAPDEPALYEDLTLAEHLRFTALAYRSPEAEAAALGWLRRFGLADRLGEFPAAHSRGMRQKLSLALALGLERPLTLLDEPYNGLDAEAQLELTAGLRERCAAGGAVLVSAHQGEVAAALGARVARLENGRLAGEAGP